MNFRSARTSTRYPFNKINPWIELVDSCSICVGDWAFKIENRMHRIDTRSEYVNIGNEETGPGNASYGKKFKR
jgi:hypothetical protein